MPTAAETIVPDPAIASQHQDIYDTQPYPKFFDGLSQWAASLGFNDKRNYVFNPTGDGTLGICCNSCCARRRRLTDHTRHLLPALHPCFAQATAS